MEAPRACLATVIALAVLALACGGGVPTEAAASGRDADEETSDPLDMGAG